MNMNTTEKNKEVIRQVYEQCLNTRNFSLLPQLVSDSFVGLQNVKGPAGFEGPVAPLIKAFPDMQWKIEELLAEDNKVVVKWKWQGTHTGHFQNLATVGQAVTNEGMAIFT